MANSRSPDTPFLGSGGDQFTVGERRPMPAGGSDDGLEGLVSNALAAMSAGGEDADLRYQRSLDALRARDAEVTASATAKYRGLDEDQYQERWSVVQLLTDLRSPAAVDTLRDILTQPIPEERGSDPVHGISTVAEEVIIRTTAIEALSRLVAVGSDDAAEVLVQQLQSDVPSIRRAVIQAANDSGDSTVINRVRESVEGTDDEWMLRLRRVGVGTVPQPDPRRDLDARKPERGDVPPPPFAQ